MNSASFDPDMPEKCTFAKRMFLMIPVSFRNMFLCYYVGPFGPRVEAYMVPGQTHSYVYKLTDDLQALSQEDGESTDKSLTGKSSRLFWMLFQTEI